jgi:hypothetical protein
MDVKAFGAHAADQPLQPLDISRFAETGWHLDLGRSTFIAAPFAASIQPNHEAPLACRFHDRRHSRNAGNARFLC